MKSILLACCLFLVAEIALGDGKYKIEEKIKEEIDQCGEEKQMSPVDVDMLFRTDLEGEEKTKYGCLHACILGRLYLMKDSRLDVDGFSSVLNKLFEKEPEKITTQLETMTKCAEEVKEITDECEIGYDFARCVTTIKE